MNGKDWINFGHPIGRKGKEMSVARPVPALPPKCRMNATTNFSSVTNWSCLQTALGRNVVPIKCEMIGFGIFI